MRSTTLRYQPAAPHPRLVPPIGWTGLWYQLDVSDLAAAALVIVLPDEDRYQPSLDLDLVHETPMWDTSLEEISRPRRRRMNKTDCESLSGDTAVGEDTIGDFVHRRVGRVRFSCLASPWEPNWPICACLPVWNELQGTGANIA